MAQHQIAHLTCQNCGVHAFVVQMSKEHGFGVICVHCGKPVIAIDDSKKASELIETSLKKSN